MSPYVPVIRLSKDMIALAVILVWQKTRLPKTLKWGLQTYQSRRMEWLRQQRGGQCERCGSKIFLEFAHVVETSLKGHSRGQWNRIKDIERYPCFYVLLCVDCHAYLDEMYHRIRYDRDMMCKVLP